MSLDDKLEGAKCLVKGKLQYQSKGDKPDLYHCAMSECECPYYKLVDNKEYCCAYLKPR